MSRRASSGVPLLVGSIAVGTLVFAGALWMIAWITAVTQALS